ncbi:hypothetical protein GGI42DRAFT_3946 [Trichoderma sp. SZMC 28013]
MNSRHGYPTANYWSFRIEMSGMRSVDTLFKPSRKDKDCFYCSLINSIILSTKYLDHSLSWNLGPHVSPSYHISFSTSPSSHLISHIMCSHQIMKPAWTPAQSAALIESFCACNCPSDQRKHNHHVNLHCSIQNSDKDRSSTNRSNKYRPEVSPSHPSQPTDGLSSIAMEKKE